MPQAQSAKGGRVAAKRHAALTRREFLTRFGLGGFAVGAAASLIGLPLVHGDDRAGQIPHGIAIGGIPVGGLTGDEALAQLSARFSAYLARPIPVVIEHSSSREIAPGTLSLQADLVSVVAQAQARSSQPFGALRDRLGALIGGPERDLPLPVTLSDAALRATIEAWAEGIAGKPVDARLAVAADGRLTVTPERPGVGFDLGVCRDAFLAHAARLASGAVALALAPVAAAVTAPQLGAVTDHANALTAKPFRLTLDDRSWTIEAATLRAAFGYRRVDEALRVVLDTATLRPALATIGGEVGSPAAGATIARDETGRYAIVPERAGQSLDEAATVAAIATALEAEHYAAGIVMVPQVPPVTAAGLEPLYAQLDRALNTPLVVRFGEYERVLGRDQILPLVGVRIGDTAGGQGALSIDPDALRALAETVAAEMNQEARDAVFAWRDGAVRELVTAREGRVLQLEPTMQALAAAILGATGTATPVVSVTPPRVSASAGEQIAVTDRLGGGRSDYSWSLPDRKVNVELAIERLDGALIPPGAIFSFNGSVGEQTIANGYKEGYGIALVGGTPGSGGEVKTVSSIGGGICQVSTILFQVIYRAGLPIEERNWHLYWIPSYGAPPSGLQGLDATVDSASGLDFKFRNSTGGWLAIEAVADGAEMRIALYGVDPGWTVVVSDPAITNERPADPTHVIEKTHDLAPGERIAIEHAVDGFDAANHVLVTDKTGEVVREATFTSNYHPSRNVTQVGVPADAPLD